MPTLPSFITGRKSKTSSSKTAFFNLRGEPSPVPVPPQPPQSQPPQPPLEYLRTDIIEINNQSRGYSLDFDGGRPNDEFEKAIFDQTSSIHSRPDNTESPRVKLDLEFSSPEETFTDWFTSNLLANFPPSVPSGELKAGGSGLRNEVPAVVENGGSSNASNSRAELLPHHEDGKDIDSISTSSSEDVIANLQAMNPSHFGKLPGFDDFNRLDQPVASKKIPQKPAIIIPGKSKPQNGSPDSIPSSYRPSRPMSTAESLVSSAISGSTFARALMSNPYMLPSDSRASRYLRGAGGLARTDSTTLPRSEHSHGSYHNNDRFSIAPDAPPIPLNAEALYQPPKTPRGQVEGNDEHDQTLNRLSSIGNGDSKALPQTPSVSSTRPTSTLLSPGVEFDMNSIIQPITPEANSHKPFSVPRSPLPLPPTPKLPYLSSEDGNSSKHSSKHGSVPEEYQEAIQRFPLDSQLLSPDYQFSPALSSEGPPSGRDLDGVLNYYSLPDTPDMQPSSSYQPAFSPISEESISQLSPPPALHFRNPERRESTRSTPLGGRSPSGSPRTRIESVTLPRRPSDRNFSRAPSILSVAERANSTTQASSPVSTYSTSSKTSSVAPELLAPPPSNIFNRTRPGTAPSPIKVIRDSKDANAYKIMVSPQMLENGTPTTEEDEDSRVMQEFPETPDMFSPVLTDDSHSVSPVRMSANGDEITPMSTVPLSATLPRGGSQSFAQAVMLTRAGTTVGHSRQPSITKAYTFNGTRPRSPSVSTQSQEIPPDIANPAPSAQEEDSNSILSVGDKTIQPLTEEPAEIQSTEEQSTALNRISLISAQSRYSRASSLAQSVGQGSDSSSMYSQSETSRRQRSLPAVPGSPVPPMPNTVAPSASPSPASSHASLPVQPPISQQIETSVPAPPPAPSTSEPISAVSDVNRLPSTTPRIPPPPVIPPPSPSPSQKARSTIRGKMPPALTITNVGAASENTVVINGPDTAEGSPASSIPNAANLPTTMIQNPNNLQDQNSLTYKPGFLTRDSDIFRGTSLGSPPPYYEAISNAIAQNAHPSNSHNVNSDQTPTTSFPGNSSFNFPARNASSSSLSTPPAPSPPTSDWTSTPQPEFRVPSSLVRENSIISQRSRMRPPLPAGPRRPSQFGVAGYPSHQFRDRSGSVSSVGSSNLLMQAIREREASTSTSINVSPKFQAPSPKWRGYTMEAAKWTFTSSQLQAIVSRAIRQSAEASSIRLLRLEILDNDIPEEMRRLQAQATELQNRYKSWSRRRNALIEGLAMYVNGGDEDTPAYAVRMMEDLKDVTSMLDKFVEEMHSVDAQLAHLESLTQIHSGSALAMALRKLNTSFLKQVAENQTLRSQIQSLEAERDEAWQHAADAANELDKMESVSSSRRSSRISAVRKSSVRASKAGLRTPSQRLSQLSSHGSGIHAFGLTPKSPMPRSVQRIPPVPSLPSTRRRPSKLFTDMVNRSSAASPGYTPTSETEALIEAQDELYAMLGLKNPERPRRSRSISILSGGSSSAAHHPFLQGIRPVDTPMLQRRSSLPGESTLAEAYNAMEADRNAVLATIDMLSSAD